MLGSVEVFGNFGSKDQSQILQELNSAPIVGVDTETHTIEDKTLIGLAIAPNPNYAVWFKEDSPYLYIALNILRNPAVTKVFHNSKFDFDALELLAIDETNFEDPMILAYTLNLPQKLYNLAVHLGKTVPDKFFRFTIPKGGSMLDVWNSDPNFVLQKCCLDASLALWCWWQLHMSPYPQWIDSYSIDRNIVHCLRHI